MSSRGNNNGQRQPKPRNTASGKAVGRPPKAGGAAAAARAAMTGTNNLTPAQQARRTAGIANANASIQRAQARIRAATLDIQQAHDTVNAANDVLAKALAAKAAADKTYQQHVTGFGWRSVTNLPGQVGRITRARDTADTAYRRASLDKQVADVILRQAQQRADSANQDLQSAQDFLANITRSGQR